MSFYLYSLSERLASLEARLEALTRSLDTSDIYSPPPYHPIYPKDAFIKNYSFMEPTEFSLSANDSCYFTGLPSLVKPLPKFSKIKPAHSYSSSYFHYLSKNKFTDLVIEVGEEPDIERFNAHKEILSN
ncbi:7671_t:CDS:1, partial [Racocetra persica]